VRSRWRHSFFSISLSFFFSFSSFFFFFFLSWRDGGVNRQRTTTRSRGRDTAPRLFFFFFLPAEKRKTPRVCVCFSFFLRELFFFFFGDTSSGRLFGSYSSRGTSRCSFLIPSFSFLLNGHLEVCIPLLLFFRKRHGQTGKCGHRCVGSPSFFFELTLPSSFFIFFFFSDRFFFFFFPFAFLREIDVVNGMRFRTLFFRTDRSPFFSPFSPPPPSVGGAMMRKWRR